MAQWRHKGGVKGGVKAAPTLGVVTVGALDSLTVGALGSIHTCWLLIILRTLMIANSVSVTAPFCARPLAKGENGEVIFLLFTIGGLQGSPPLNRVV